MSSVWLSIGVKFPYFTDVWKYFLLVQNYCKVKLNNVIPSVSEIENKVVEKIEEILHAAYLPIFLRQRIVQIIRTHIGKYKNIKKYFGIETLSASTLETKIIIFEKDSGKLFDIFLCKCVSFGKCSCTKLTNIEI